MYDFQYVKPKALAEAASILAGDGEAKALAGGMTFIPVLKQRLNKPSKVVDLAGLGLSGIKVSGETVEIGAMTTHAAVANSADVKRAIPALAKLAANIGDEAVRHRGTIGGSLANNDPSACYPSAVLALGGTIVTNKRRIEADDYFQGMFATALAQDEVITSVRVPGAGEGCVHEVRQPGLALCDGRRVRGEGAEGRARGGNGGRAERRVPPQGDGRGAGEELVRRCAGGCEDAGGRAEQRHPCEC